MTIQPPKVPINYFGRGRDYTLPDDSTIVQEITDAFSKYERDHPEDPLGEAVLTEWETSHHRTSTVETTRKLDKIKPMSIQFTDYGRTTQIRLELPEQIIDHLKGFARYTRRRPREIVSDFIKTLKYPGQSLPL